MKATVVTIGNKQVYQRLHGYDDLEKEKVYDHPIGKEQDNKEEEAWQIVSIWGKQKWNSGMIMAQIWAVLPSLWSKAQLRTTRHEIEIQSFKYGNNKEVNKKID